MEWLIEDALPPTLLQAALAPKISAAAPHLLAALQRSTPVLTRAHPSDTLCTPGQAWLIERAGFTSTPALPPGGAWPSYQQELNHPGSVAPNTAIWWAQPCHMAVSQHGVSLMEPATLAVQPDEAQALNAAIADDLAEAGVQVLPTSGTDVWHWQLPTGWNPQAATVECVAGQEIHTWWSQDEATRPWRRLLNLIQMIWHDHPVNQARRAAGQAEINSIWLQGGACPQLLPELAATRTVQRFQPLSKLSRDGDWEAWLQALAKLDQQYLAPSSRTQPPTKIILTGQASWLTLEPKPAGLFSRWFSRRRDNWQEFLFEDVSDL